MSRSLVEKYATNSATPAEPMRPYPSASQMLGGLTEISAAAAPYMPRPKKAECPNDTIPVYPMRMSEDIASSPQIRISVTKRCQNCGSTSGAMIRSAEGDKDGWRGVEPNRGIGLKQADEDGCGN